MTMTMAVDTVTNDEPDEKSAELNENPIRIRKVVETFRPLRNL